MMVELHDEADLESLGAAASEFLDNWRAGRSPSVEAFAARHPALAAPIRELFPVLLALEGLRASPMDSGQNGVPPENRPGPFLPARLGEYELVRELGRGGMGIVFEARQPALDRRVAIKVLPGWHGRDRRDRARFLREARIIARLRHPGIVPIHALGEQDGVLYYVMDLIEGTSLDQGGPAGAPGMSGRARARWVAGLGVQAAEALAHAHGQGILHRDVKPSNFLLDQDGRLWLTDFGLATHPAEPSLTASGQWLGTLRYLAPECLRGEASQRSDVYGLGLTLYELLVDRPAFPEPNRHRLLGTVAEPAPVPLRTLDPTIPRDLETIILKACEPVPEHRYPTAAAVAEDLRRFLDAQPIRGRRGGRAARLLRWVRRNGAVALLTALALTLALVVAVLALSRGPAGSVSTPPATTLAPADEPGEARGVVKQGPPWGFGRRHAPAGQGAGGGRGPRGPRRGIGPPSS